MLRTRQTARRNRHETRKLNALGFHLIELLITMAIIGILAIVGVQTYPQYLARVHHQAALADLEKIANALELYHFEHLTYKGATLEALHMQKQQPNDYYHFSIDTGEANYQIRAEPTAKQRCYDTEVLNLIFP